MSVPITPSLYGNLEEIKDAFTFRNSGQFKIPKYRREKAYTMSIDVTIETVDWNVYENSKSLPSTDFYGYVVLVYQDSVRDVIPVRFPMQRVYSERNTEALRQWNESAVFWEHWQYYKRLEIELASIKGAFEIPDLINYSDDFGDSKWIELPLREVYFKFPRNTQFSVEYIQWQPVSYEDPLGNTREGRSNQEDSDEDTGLPKTGTDPIKNSPSDPFANAPSNKGTPSLDNGFLLELGNLEDEQEAEIPVAGDATLCTLTISTLEDDGSPRTSNTISNVPSFTNEIFIVDTFAANANSPLNTLNRPVGYVIRSNLRPRDSFQGSNWLIDSDFPWSYFDTRVTGTCVLAP